MRYRFNRVILVFMTIPLIVMWCVIYVIGFLPYFIWNGYALDMHICIVKPMAAFIHRLIPPRKLE